MPWRSQGIAKNYDVPSLRQAFVMKHGTPASKTAEALFDAHKHSDPSPASHCESSFDFLNRVDSPYWGKVRQLLDAWFAVVPGPHQKDLRARFRSPDPPQHVGAWWELYLHAAFIHMGFEVDIHPALPSTDARPDFRLTQGETEIYLEATTLFSAHENKLGRTQREGWIKDAIDLAHCPNFFIWLELEKRGMEKPSPKAISRPIEEWTRNLDPDAVARSMGDGQEPPRLPLAVKDWRLCLRAFPLRPEARGRPGHRPYGAGPTMTRGGEAGGLRTVLARKRRRYGNLNAPFILAVLSTSGFTDEEDVTEALFGTEAVVFREGEPGSARTIRRPDGLWTGPSGPRATRVSAVLAGLGTMPWTCARNSPRLWRNPFASHPVADLPPFHRGSVTATGRIDVKDSAVPPSALFHLSPEWPGPEPPFPRGNRESK